MKLKIKRLWILVLSIVILSQSKHVFAEESKGTSNQQFESSVDLFFQEKMKEYDIPGAAIVVVDHGRVILEKNYGLSDVENNKKFDKNTTFRIASITKTFTATALMKLVEEGKVNLDEDIKTYLPQLTLRNPYRVPVTVKNLLSHTSGIDSSSLMELSDKELDMPKGFLLDEMNAKNLTVITEPGTCIEYCSYGVVLEGCIIEAVSGESCSDYIKNNILLPLSMKNTKMSMKDKSTSHGYIMENGKLKEYTMGGYFKLYPEGGLISSIQDMSSYLQLFLNKGYYDGKQILEENTTKTMMQQCNTYDAILPGTTYGFSEYKEQGIRIVGHGGYAPDGYLTQIDLYPQYEVGTFIVVNQGSNNDITGDFRQILINYMNWKSREDVVNNTNSQDYYYDISGSYRFSDYSKTTLCKGDVFGGIGEVTISNVNNDEIKVSGIDEFSGKSYEYHATKLDNTHYKVIDKSKYIVFLLNGKKVTGMAMTDDSWHGYYERLGWYETAKVQVPVFVLILLIYLICFIYLIIKLVLYVIWKRNKNISNWDRKRYFAQIWVSFMNAGFIIYALYRWGDRLRYCIPMDVKINLMMPIAGSVGMVVFLIMTLREIYKKQGKMKNHIFDICFLEISILYILILIYWNLFGFHY